MPHNKSSQIKSTSVEIGNANAQESSFPSESVLQINRGSETMHALFTCKLVQITYLHALNFATTRMNVRTTYFYFRMINRYVWLASGEYMCFGKLFKESFVLTYIKSSLCLFHESTHRRIKNKRTVEHEYLQLF